MPVWDPATVVRDAAGGVVDYAFPVGETPPYECIVCRRPTSAAPVIWETDGKKRFMPSHCARVACIDKVSEDWPAEDWPVIDS